MKRITILDYFDKKENYTELLNISQKVPQTEVEYMKKYITSLKEKGFMEADNNLFKMTDIGLRAFIVKLRYGNPICNFCHKKDNDMLLSRCAKCKLVFYCSELCQKMDWNEHKTYCCKNDYVVKPNDLYSPVIMEHNDKKFKIIK
jgi:hypothetical protein